MKRSELAEVLMFIGKAYPGRLKYPSGDEHEDVALEETWLVFLRDLDFQAVMMLLKDVLPKKHPQHPPSAPEIVAAYNQAAAPPENRLPADEAWAHLMKVMPKYSRYHKREFMASLPERTRQVVESMGGIRVIEDRGLIDPFCRKTFIDTYKEQQERLESEPKPGLIDAISRGVSRLGEGMRELPPKKEVIK